MARTPDTTRRSERSRLAILDAARALLADTPYAKLTIEAIAARAGVGKQTIYRWWPTKGAVVLDAILALSEHPDSGGIALPDTGDLAADLTTVLRATVAELADPAFGAPLRALMTEILNDPDLAATYRDRMHRPVHDAKIARLRSAQDAGQLAPDADLDLLIDLLYSPVTQRWLTGTGPLDDAFADALVTTVLRGFATP
ncbi:TetR/AcrR family transcriptional regulator [Nocardia thailandica]|uniref:TetR/AcrR family transcriptional regulator n=1 Tax=Nocardia thailandica TaxID=257275 RepID=UPI000317DA17|nr:TetR/AcrR family transcriptional regulator [Nocardia thailandica]